MKKILFALLTASLIIPLLSLAAPIVNQAANRHPVITKVEGPLIVGLNQPSTYTVKSQEPNGDRYELIIDWNEGSPSMITIPAGTSSIVVTRKFTKSFANQGKHRLMFRAADSKGKEVWTSMEVDVMSTSTATSTMGIANRHPIITAFTGPSNPLKGKAYTYTVKSYEPNGEPYRLFVNWGDESSNPEEIINATNTTVVVRKYSHMYGANATSSPTSTGSFEPNITVRNVGSLNQTLTYARTSMIVTLQTATGGGTSTAAFEDSNMSASLMAALAEQIEDLKSSIEWIFDQIKEIGS